MPQTANERLIYASAHIRFAMFIRLSINRVRINPMRLEIPVNIATIVRI